MSIFFTSDLHFDHKGILKHMPKSRPFANQNEMNDMIIHLWNIRVQPEDEIYVLGDIGFCGTTRLRALLSRLNGKKHLIRGNHDGHSKGFYGEFFLSVNDILRLDIPDGMTDDGKNKIQSIVLCHYPIISWEGIGRGSWHLHGHCHGGLNIGELGKNKIMDVGIDCWNLAPLSYDEVKKIMSERGFTPVDYHTGERG